MTDNVLKEINEDRTGGIKIILARAIKDVLFLAIIAALVFTVFVQITQNTALRNNNLILNVQMGIVRSGGTLPPIPKPKPVVKPPEEPTPDTGYILPGFNIPDDVMHRLISYTSTKHCPTHGVVCDWRSS